MRRKRMRAAYMDEGVNEFVYIISGELTINVNNL